MPSMHSGAPYTREDEHIIALYLEKLRNAERLLPARAPAPLLDQARHTVYQAWAEVVEELRQAGHAQARSYAQQAEPRFAHVHEKIDQVHDEVLRRGRTLLGLSAPN